MPGGAADLFIGLMSGTSLDGVDAVLADFSGGVPQLLAHVHHGFDAQLRAELLALTRPGADEIERCGMAAQGLAHAYASAVADLLDQARVPAASVAAIGAHGQTVRHCPQRGFTVQLNAPALLAELSGIAVVADFRSRDLAAGGQGAPLVPAFHSAVFGGTGARAVVNIGGISNISALPGQVGGVVRGFDCGPGNLLLDAWTQRHLGRAFDEDGEWASTGTVDVELLEQWLGDPFFSAAPPKSTGRELFHLNWLLERIGARKVAAADVQATLVALTAAGIGEAISRWCPESEDVLVCGGGAYNRTLMRELSQRCGGRPVASTASVNLAPEHVEALAFAWLAHAHLHGKAGNLPEVTGARGPRVLGAYYPA